MHIKRIAGVFTVAAVVLTPLIVFGVADPSPTQHYAATVTDNVFAAVAASDGSFYVAGNFISGAARSYGNAILASASTGLSESPFPDVDGDVNAVISDGAGGWYIGGVFNRVGDLQRTGVAHINADGTADAGFASVITGGTPIIWSLVLDEDDDILYVGCDPQNGEFSGANVTALFALDATTGDLAGGFTLPTISGGDASVYALALDEDSGYIYTGGSFSTIGVATTRNNLARFDAGSGATTSYNPNVNGDVLTLAINTANGYHYAGGIFTSVNGGTTRNNVALFDSGGTVDDAFDVNANGAVNTLALDATNFILYLGGAFTDINLGIARNRLAAVGDGDGFAIAFDPDLDGTVRSVALTADGDTLYAVGGFTDVNGGTTRNGTAAFDTDIHPTANVLPFQQVIDQETQSIALSDDETSVLIGAEDGANSFADRGPVVAVLPIYHILADGMIDPDFDAYADGDSVYTLALSPDELTLYAGGSFTSVNGGTLRNHLAAFDAVTGTETSFDPDLDGSVYALALSSDGGILYAGGEFGNVNVVEDSEPRNNLAAFDTDIHPTDNELPFNPNVDDGGSVNALALTGDDATLYVGGDFLEVNGGLDRDFIAAFDTTTGIATAFDPGVDDTVYAVALSSDESELFAGGSFEDVNYGAETREWAAAFETDMGAATAFEPDVNDDVLALAFGPDGVLYMGGTFVADGFQQRIVAVDADTGARDAGFTTHLNDTVFALAHGGTDNGLLAGGRFKVSFEDDGTELPYVVTNYLAHYADSSTPTPTPATPTPTPESGGGSSGGSVGWTWPGATPTPSATPPPTGLPTRGDPLNLGRYGLREGDTITGGGDDPDVYIVNEWGYKRLFLNPIIFSFYGHLGFELVKGIAPAGRDVFPTSGLFRNCETGDPRVFAVEVTGEDTGVLHHVQVPGDVAVSQDPDFFRKVFCINNNEFNWYPKSPTPYTALWQIPSYRR